MGRLMRCSAVELWWVRRLGRRRCDFERPAMSRQFFEFSWIRGSLSCLRYPPLLTCFFSTTSTPTVHSHTYSFVKGTMMIIKDFLLYQPFFQYDIAPPTYRRLRIADIPPSNLIMEPVTKAEALEDKNKVKPAISSSFPYLPTGCESLVISIPCSVFN